MYEIVQQLRRLYCHNLYSYCYMYPTPEGGAYITPKEPLQETDLYDHLDGKKTVCVSGRQRTTTFMTFDIDTAGEDNVRNLLAKLKEVGIPDFAVHVSTSGNKGYHVDIFFDNPIYKSIIENFFDCLRRDPVIGSIVMECRPIHSTTIKIPLGINFRTGRRCWYLDKDTLLPIESFEYVLGIKKMLADDFRSIALEMNRRRKAEDIEAAKRNMQEIKVAPRVKKKKKQQFSQKKELVITAPGQRHEMMMRKAVWLRSNGADEEDIYKELIDWVERQNQGQINSSWREIEDDARRITAYVMRRTPVKVQHYIKRETRSHSVISERDVQVVLAIKNKSYRKIAMLIIAYSKVFGSCSMGTDVIARVAGLSHQTVQLGVKHLVEDGVIMKKNIGGLYYKNGVPLLRPNEYVLCEDAPRDRSIKANNEVEYRIQDIKDDFDSFYYETLKTMVGEDALKHRLTKTEMGRLDAG